MSSSTKIIVTVLLIGVVVGIFYLQSDKSLFKGQISGRDFKNETENNDKPVLPDLSADLVVVAPEKDDDDISVSVTVLNLGPGSITGDQPFKYTIYMNDVEVFSNSDSYTAMNKGDSFTFVYPISRAIYNYSEKGKARVVVDDGNRVEEVDEENNEAEVYYSL